MFIESDIDTRLILLKVYNKIQETENIPRSWLNRTLKQLYKGKDIQGKCSNERGITLASNAGKLYERMINV